MLEVGVAWSEVDDEAGLEEPVVGRDSRGGSSVSFDLVVDGESESLRQQDLYPGVGAEQVVGHFVPQWLIEGGVAEGDAAAELVAGPCTEAPAGPVYDLRTLGDQLVLIGRLWGNSFVGV